MWPEHVRLSSDGRCEFNFNTRSQSCMELRGWVAGGRAAAGRGGADIKIPLVQDAALSAAPRRPGGGLTPARHAYTQLTHNLDARLREWTSPRPESIPQIQDYITNRETLGLRNALCLSWKFSAKRCALFTFYVKCFMSVLLVRSGSIRSLCAVFFF